MYGRLRGSMLRLGVQSDHVNPRLGAGKCRKIERRRNRHRKILDKIRRVHHRRSEPRGKRECTLEVPAPAEPECSGKGWWTMLGLGGAVPNAEGDADGGVEEDAASRVLILMTFWSIKSYTAPHRVKQLFVKCLTTR